jgi:outer membrane protein W
MKLKNKKVMKKSILAVAAIAMFGFAANAQRPVDANPFSLEGGLSLGNTTFSAPELRLRYFAADNIAGRLGVSLMNTSETINFYGDGTDGLPHVDSLGIRGIKESMTWISIGGSYHFSQLDRLSPYGFLDVMIGMGSYGEEWTDFDGADYAAGIGASLSTSTSGLGVRFGGGFDYYFAENVFIGAEVGFMYLSNTDKGGDFTVSAGSTTTTIKLHPQGNASSFANSATAQVRLGWRF